MVNAQKPTQRMYWNEYYRNHGDAWRKETEFEEGFNGKKVLELGCGNGKSVAGILRKKARSLTAMDFSEVVLRICEKKFPEVEFVHGYCQSLPFESNSFDIVVANHIIGALKEKEREKAVKEIHRILKKGGKAMFSDFARGDLREKGSLEEKGTRRKKNGIIQHFFTKKEAESLFSGFSEAPAETKSNYLVLSGKKVLRSEIFVTAKK